jgi:hypothetical protein
MIVRIADPKEELARAQRLQDVHAGQAEERARMRHPLIWRWAKWG